MIFFLIILLAKKYIILYIICSKFIFQVDIKAARLVLPLIFEEIMSVSALTNTFYNYVPVTSSQYDSNSSSSSVNSQNTESVKAVDEKSSQIQASPNTYKENSENTSNNNSNNNSDNTSYLTGEEILASRPENKSEKSTTSSANGLTDAEQEQVDELKSRDREVKNHEQAHIAAGGSYVKGGASYDYQTGPDGRQYAVGGSVNIDTSPVPDDPEATIAKAQVIIKAALAPAEPSGQDQKVASQARQMMSDARQELSSVNNNTSQQEENTANETNSQAEETQNNSSNNESSNNTAFQSTLGSSDTVNQSSKNTDKNNNAANTSNADKTVNQSSSAQAAAINQNNNSAPAGQSSKTNNATATAYSAGSLISLIA